MARKGSKALKATCHDIVGMVCQLLKGGTMKIMLHLQLSDVY